MAALTADQARARFLAMMGAMIEAAKALEDACSALDAGAAAVTETSSARDASICADVAEQFGELANAVGAARRVAESARTDIARAWGA